MGKLLNYCKKKKCVSWKDMHHAHLKLFKVFISKLSVKAETDRNTSILYCGSSCSLCLVC